MTRMLAALEVYGCSIGPEKIATKTTTAADALRCDLNRAHDGWTPQRELRTHSARENIASHTIIAPKAPVTTVIQRLVDMTVILSKRKGACMSIS